jgi:hypothetical protein
MILITNRYKIVDIQASRHFFEVKSVFVLLSISLIMCFPVTLVAADQEIIIETDNIIMMGKRENNQDKPIPAPTFQEKKQITQPIIFLGNRKESP